MKRRQPLRPDPEKVRQFLQRGRKPLKRKPLRVDVLPDFVEVELRCVVCGDSFTHRRRKYDYYLPKMCSPKCRSAAKREKMRDRNGTKNPNFRHGHRVGQRNREGEERWRKARKDYCERHPEGCSRKRLYQHHIVYRQHLRLAGGDEWDPRNSLTLCVKAHSAHHNRKGGEVLPLLVLPDSAYEYAVDLFGAPKAYEYLRRRYAGTDPRLDALLQV